MIDQSTFQSAFYRKKVKITPNPAGHWRVGKIILDGTTRDATWECQGCMIFVMFPKEHNPLPGEDTQVSGQDTASAQFKDTAKGYYPYCILVQDGDGDFHLVEGNSPPEMIIE